MQGPTTPPAPTARAHERHRRGMGGDVHLIATGDPAFLDAALDRAEARLVQLEARWSCVRSDSELSRLNREGFVVGASDDLLDAIEGALDAWRSTDARFDPTVHDADLLPGPEGAAVDRTQRRIDLPEGVRLDLGGIGKGFAADLLVDQLMADGCDGACANIGGDVRVRGRGPNGASWTLGVEDPLLPGSELTRVRVDDGAVATSASVRAGRGLVGVTVIAPEARWAEVLTRAAFVAGPDEGVALIEDAGACGLLITASGVTIRTTGFDRYEHADCAIDLDRAPQRMRAR